MEYLVLPLHKHLEYLQDSCNLINNEWKRSDTARLRSLEASCDQLPTSLILLRDKKLIGYLKLSPIPSIKDGCFVESVVIEKNERGKGYGSILMKKAEDYCRNNLSNLNVIYLSTKGQEGFYTKLGYTECMPISIYGCLDSSLKNHINTYSENDNGSKVCITKNVPAAPPMPRIHFNTSLASSKKYMKKEL